MLIYEYVTGGGLAGLDLPESWAVEGRAMRRALAEDFAVVPGVRVVMALDARLPDEPGPWTVVRIGPGQSITDLSAVADHTALIAPETGGVLADLARSIPNSLGCDPDSIELSADKLRLADHLIARGIPTPIGLKVRPSDGLPRDFPYPAVLKPIDGAGSLDTFFVSSHRDSLTDLDDRTVALLQPYIPGEPKSATFIAGPGQLAMLVGVSRQTISREGRRFSYHGGSILDESLPDDHPARLAVAAVSGLRGLIGVDFIDDPTTGPIVIEINPRPTTSCVGLVIALGPGCLAAAWLGVVSDSYRSTCLRTPIQVDFSADGTVSLRPPHLSRTDSNT